MLDGQEWNFLLTGVHMGVKVDKNLVEKLVQTVDWIDEKRANDFTNLSFLPRFSDICESFGYKQRRITRALESCVR